jgi:hypothetical protein
MVTLWLFVHHWSIISTGKISTAFVKNMARNRQRVLILSRSVTVGLHFFPQDIPLDPTTLEFLSGISLKPDTFKLEGGRFTSSCPFRGESFSVHISLHKSSCIMHHQFAFKCPVNDRRIRGLSSMVKIPHRSESSTPASPDFQHFFSTHD